jgi:Asp-tRNA(Asn)/Glu-tRNA(Gln) amidotransferase A subunit family amidase
MTGRTDRWGAFVEHAPQPAAGTGQLSGLRVAVKDSIAANGLKWTAGLPLLQDRRADEDAVCVAAVRAAGAEIVGVTATDAAGFGMMTPGVVNPLDAKLSAGGSSGGSAAAVAAGLADIALGTDTAGSVRVPVACCGVYGFKPSYGRVSTVGVTPLSASFDHVGVMAARLDVLTRAACVLLDEPEPALPDRPLVVAHDPSHLDHVPEEVAATVRGLLARLRVQGHMPLEVALPDPEDLTIAHGAIVCAEAREAWSAHWPQHAQRFGETARRSLAYAQSVSAADVDAAWRIIDEARGTIARAFEGVDLIIGPTLALPPPVVGSRRVRIGAREIGIIGALMRETCPFNVSGHPALAMPARRRIGRVPVSIQVAGKSDMQLLGAAPIIEKALSEMG